MGVQDIVIEDHDGHSQFTSPNWKLCLDRRLSAEQLTAVQAVFVEQHDKLWDKDGQEFHLPAVVWCIQLVAPGAVVLEWEHKPVYVKITGLNGLVRVFQLLNVFSFSDAVEEARRAWHREIPAGTKTAVLSAKLASRKDMRKVLEDKELED